VSAHPDTDSCPAGFCILDCVGWNYSLVTLLFKTFSVRLGISGSSLCVEGRELNFVKTAVKNDSNSSSHFLAWGKESDDVVL
jgi:hypothetical protein